MSSFIYCVVFVLAALDDLSLLCLLAVTEEQEILTGDFEQ